MSIREKLHAEIDRISVEDLQKVERFLRDLSSHQRLTLQERREVLRGIGISGLPTIPAECLGREQLYD